MNDTYRAMNTCRFYLTVTLSASLAFLVGCDDSEAKARHRVECSNHLKIVGMAMVLYAQDHENLAEGLNIWHGLGDSAQPTLWPEARGTT